LISTVEEFLSKGSALIESRDHNSNFNLVGCQFLDQIDLYQQQFHLNDHETELITTLIPKRQMLIKNPDASKVANLNVDPKSYWLYTNDPFDNRKRDEVFAAHGFEKGLEVLAGMKPGH